MGAAIATQYTIEDETAPAGNKYSVEDAPAPPSMWQRMKSNFNSNTQGAKPGDALIKTAVENFGAGGGDVIRSLAHPIRTAEGAAKASFGESEDKGVLGFAEEVGGPGVRSAIDIGKGLLHQPARTLGQLGTGSVIGEAVGGLPKAVGAVIPKIDNPITRTLTDTTPRDTAVAVRQASADNAAEVAKADEKNAAADSARKVDLKKHFEKSAAAADANTDSASAVSRRQAITRGIEQADEPLRADIKSLRDKAHAAADAKYVALNSALDDVPASPVFLGSALEDAASQIKGSNTKPAIFSDMEKRFNSGDPLTYRDLQGYYSEVGRELSKGTLPGDIYHAYDVLQEHIGDEMQRLAKTKGLDGKLGDARATWRQLKQTFYDPKSPVTKALSATERGGTVKAFQTADRAGVEALAKYDPTIAQRVNSLRTLTKEAKELPAKPAPLKSVPKLGPKPQPVEPSTTTLTPTDIQQTKMANLLKSTDQMRHSKSPLVSAVAGYGTIKALLLRNLPTAGLDITARLLYGAAKPALADLLENPRVVSELTKFTPRDAAAIAKLPADQRAAFVGDLTPIVKAAWSKGIPVSAALAGLTAAQQSEKRVGAVLPKMRDTQVVPADPQRGIQPVTLTTLQ